MYIHIYINIYIYTYIYIIPFVQGCFAYQLSYHGDDVGVVLDPPGLHTTDAQERCHEGNQKISGRFGFKMRLKHQKHVKICLKAPVTIVIRCYLPTINHSDIVKLEL